MAVLVGRWTGGMGEGITIGLDGMGRASVIGTQMAGLHGATYTFTLLNTKITIDVLTVRSYHVYGTSSRRLCT